MADAGASSDSDEPMPDPFDSEGNDNPDSDIPQRMSNNNVHKSTRSSVDDAEHSGEELATLAHFLRCVSDPFRSVMPLSFLGF